jgi:hypothetical protein
MSLISTKLYLLSNGWKVTWGWTKSQTIHSVCQAIYSFHEALACRGVYNDFGTYYCNCDYPTLNGLSKYFEVANKPCPQHDELTLHFLSLVDVRHHCRSCLESVDDRWMMIVAGSSAYFEEVPYCWACKWNGIMKHQATIMETCFYDAVSSIRKQSHGFLSRFHAHLNDRFLEGWWWLGHGPMACYAAAVAELAF